jgi:hypothetical protein
MIGISAVGQHTNANARPKQGKNQNVEYGREWMRADSREICTHTSLRDMIRNDTEMWQTVGAR